MDNLSGGSAVSSTAFSGSVEALPQNESSTLSYREVLSRYLVEGGGRGNSKMPLSRLDQWLTRFKLNIDSPVGNEFSVEFDRYLSAFQNSQEKEGTHAKTVANTVSTLRGLRKVFMAWLGGTDLPANFSEALRMAVARKGYTLRELKRQYKASYGVEWDNYTKWFSGQTSPGYKRARPRTTIVLHRLEDLLDLPRETLTSRAFSCDAVPMLTPVKVAIPFRDHHSALVNNKALNYSLRELPAEVQADFDRLTAWKKMDRIMVKGKGFVSIEPRHRWNKESTVKAFLNDMKSFFGYLLLPKEIDEASIPEELSETFGKTQAERRERFKAMMTGQGMALEDLRLVHLLDYELMDAYARFRQARNLNENVTQTLAGFVIRVLSLVNRDTSFLRHHPDFAARLPVPIPASDWPAWCDEHHEAMAALSRVLKKSAAPVRTRNPDEPVLHVFAQQDPLKVINDIGFRMLNTLPPPSGPVSRAIQYRNGMILLLLAFEPLRASHWPTMTIGEDLVRDSERNRWVIQVPLLKYKNAMHGYAKERQRVLPEQLSRVVDVYMDEHRQHLQRPGSNVFLLKSATGDSRYKNPEPNLTEQGFYNLIAGVMQTYLGIPVGPHVIRHIVATDYLRKNPGDFATAAAILNDSEETVRRNYSHVTQQNLLDRRDATFEENLPKNPRPL
mgnify:CR=1 FL=1